MSSQSIVGGRPSEYSHVGGNARLGFYVKPERALWRWAVWLGVAVFGGLADDELNAIAAIAHALGGE